MIGKNCVISKMAEVDVNALIATQNKIGHFCVVEGSANIGNGNVLEHGCIVRGDRTKIGDNNSFLAGVKIGYGPKDIGDPFYKGGIQIGDGNFFGESTIINCGEADKVRGDITKLGNRIFCMGLVSIAHNCQVGFSSFLEPFNGVDYDTIISTGCRLAGFTTVKLGANLALNTICHQFTWVGEGAMIGAGTTVVRDVPPFAKVIKGRICGYNQRTLQRYCGMSAPEDFAVIDKALKLIAGLPAVPVLGENPTEEQKKKFAFVAEETLHIQRLIVDAIGKRESKPLTLALNVIYDFVSSSRNGRPIMKYKE